MGAKSNLRSFRYSDEVAGILEAYKGDSFNQKFENLVLHCFWEGKRIDAQIAQKQKDYDNLCQKARDKYAELMSLDSLLMEKKRLISALDRVASDAEAYESKLEKAVTQMEVVQLPARGEKCVTKSRTKKNVTQSA